MCKKCGMIGLHVNTTCPVENAELKTLSAKHDFDVMISVAEYCSDRSVNDQCSPSGCKFWEWCSKKCRHYAPNVIIAE